MRNRLVTIGEALIDMIPAEVGCPLSHVNAFSPAVGGAPANVAAAFALLGGRASILTMLGRDAFGERILCTLADAGVDVSSVRLTNEANTALAFVSLSADGGREFAFYRKPSADMLYTGEDLTEDDFCDALALTYGSVSLGDFPMKEAHRRAIALAKRAGALTVFDPNLRFPLWKSKEALHAAVLEFLPLADILKISDEELHFITGAETLIEALPWLYAQNIRIVLYTCGEKGAYLARPGEKPLYAPAESVKAIDTTGAGDAFLGAFLFAVSRSLASGEALESLSRDVLAEALAAAVHYSGRSVTAHGAIPSYPRFL